MLVRQYIHQRLKEYYAQSASSVVGGMSEPIDFRSLWGEWHWKYVYGKRYEAQEGQWLTPTELFQPYYSQCLAEWVANRIRSQKEASDVQLVELGGGRGTNAKCLLQYLEQTHPRQYEQIQSYVLVDSSESLLDLQEKQTADCPKVTSRLCDLEHVAEGNDRLVSPEDPHTIVLALEVLDNLPHDIVKQSGGTFLQAELMESVGGRYQEIERRLTDPLLQQCLPLTPTFHRSDKWYPSIALGVLRHLLSHPQMDILIADFDMLPSNPLVTDMDDRDYNHYLEVPSSPTDILFATNFSLLAEACRNLSSKHAVKFTKQAEFLQQYPHIVQKTRSMMYSPLVDDFSNCSVLSVET